MANRTDYRLQGAWSCVSEALTELRLGSTDFKSHRLGYVNTQAEAIANDLRKVQEAIAKLQDEVRVYDNRPVD